MNKMVTLGIAQYAPIHFDLPKCMELLESIISDSAKDGIELLVFGETWLSGYPAWLDNCPEVAYWDHEPIKDAYLKMRENSICIGSNETDLIARWAKEHKINIVIGANEVVKGGKASGTIFNALLTFDNKGNLINHHRKLVPTFTEKLLYGQGDGHGLQAVDTNIGRVGGLVCWEHWMPMTRQALHNTDEDIHVAVWPTVHERHQIASRQYAFEGRCFVLAAGQILKTSAYPKELMLPPKPDDLALKGGSCIINPRGEFVVEPIFDKELLITAEIDLTERTREQMTLDTSGHYQRSDVFKFEVNQERPV